MYPLKSEIFPSLILILMGSIDCLTTVIGVLYFGASELNPLLTDIVHTNILVFLILKILATFCIGFTFILANRTLNKTVDKNTKTFKYSQNFMKIAYSGIIIFLVIIVTNNLIVLFN